MASLSTYRSRMCYRLIAMRNADVCSMSIAKTIIILINISEAQGPLAVGSYILF